MVNGILILSNNNNVIAIKYGDVGAARYLLFQKTDKKATPKIIHLARA